MESKTLLSLDLKRSSMLQVVRAKKGDTARSLEIRLQNGIEAWPVDQSYQAVMTGRKPDGTSLYNDCEVRDGKVFYQFTEQTANCIGEVNMELRIYGGQDQLITTAMFVLEIYDTVYTAQDAAKSKDEQTALNALVNKTLDAKNATEALTQEVQGKLDRGEFIGENAYEEAVRLGFQGTEEEWLNSLRYDHSEEFTALAQQVQQNTGTASQAARTAVSAAEAAADSAGAAGSSAEDAQNAQRAAADSAKLSGENAQAAAGSASAAQTAQTGARESAGAAAASAAAAKGSEDTVTSSAQAASENAQRAVTASEKAEASQAAALASRNAAADSAGAAAGSAGTAEAQARQAETAAGGALESQKKAAASETAAAESAKTAEAQAGAAKGEADRAKQEAEKAAQGALDAQTIMDDTAITDRKTRSSLKLYDTLCPPFAQTGPVVTCHPVADYPLHVVSEIAVKQEGSGDPSPTNVRPIVMQDKVELTRCGKNLLSKLIVGNIHGYGNPQVYRTWNGGWSGVIDISQFGGRTLSVAGMSEGSWYAYSDDLPVANSPVYDAKVYSGNSPIAIPLDPTHKYLVVTFVKSGNDPAPENCQIEIGSVATPYEPYTGETYTAQLPEPVAGGMVDWDGNAQIHTVTRRFDDDFTITGVSNEGKFTKFIIKWAKKTPVLGGSNYFCNLLPYVLSNNKDKESFFCAFANNDAYLKILSTRIPASTSESAKQWVIDNKLTIVSHLKLAEQGPVIISSNPTAIPGENNLYSNTGDTTVSGREDPIYNSQRKDERITALENLITEELGGM